MNNSMRSVLTAAGIVIATQAMAQVAFYEHEGFAGESFTTQKRIDDFEHYDFNDRASSAVVVGDHREMCDGWVR